MTHAPKRQSKISSEIRPVYQAGCENVASPHAGSTCEGFALPSHYAEIPAPSGFAPAMPVRSTPQMAPAAGWQSSASAADSPDCFFQASAREPARYWSADHLARCLHQSPVNRHHCRAWARRRTGKLWVQQELPCKNNTTLLAAYKLSCRRVPSRSRKKGTASHEPASQYASLQKCRSGRRC